MKFSRPAAWIRNVSDRVREGASATTDRLADYLSWCAGVFKYGAWWKAYVLMLGLLVLTGAAITVPSQLWFKASGTGAVLRKQANKEADIVSVCDYIGDPCPSGGDYTVKIQAAVTAAAGKTLLFPPGTYTITAKITLPSNITLIGNGTATLNQTTTGEIALYGTAVSNVLIQGFTITGAGSSYVPSSAVWGGITFETSGSNIAIVSNRISGFYNGIVADSLTGLQTRDNDITAWRVFAILSSLTSDFSHDSNTIHDNDMPSAVNYSGATTYARGDTVISGGTAYMSIANANLNHAPPNASWWVQVNTYGISANGPTGHSPPQTRNSITNNVIRNNPFWAGIMSHDCDGLIIANNNIRNVRAGLDLGSTIDGNYIEKIVISGNYIEDTASDYWAGNVANNNGIFLYGFDGTTNRGRQAAITGNIINGFNRFNFGSSGVGGIALQYVEGVTIVGNRIYNGQAFANSAAGGIVVSGTVNDLAITGNSVATASGKPPIFLVSNTSNNIAITGNEFSDGNQSAYAVRVSGATITRLMVKGNATNSGGYYNATTSTISWEDVDWIRTIPAALIGSTQLSNAVPNQAQGSGAPGVDEPIGSLYHRTTAGPSLYAKMATGTGGWGALVGVPGTPVALTAQVANLAATSVFAVAPAGTYRVCVNARTTTSGTGTTANVNIIWTDEGGAKTDALGTWALNSVTITGQINKCEYIHAAASSAIQVSVTAGTYGTSAYALDATAERLN